MRLSEQAVLDYRERGYLVPPYRLEPDLLQSLQQALDQLIRDNPGVRPEKLVSAHIEGQNDEGVRGSRRFLELAMHPPIVDMVEQIIGPDVVLWWSIPLLRTLLINAFGLQRRHADTCGGGSLAGGHVALASPAQSASMCHSTPQDCPHAQKDRTPTRIHTIV